MKSGRVQRQQPGIPALGPRAPSPANAPSGALYFVTHSLLTGRRQPLLLQVGAVTLFQVFGAFDGQKQA